MFGRVSTGEAVERIAISGGGLTAQILTYGAVLQDLRMDGLDAPLCVGFDNLASYETRAGCFGALMGRCANRIREGRFDLDRQSHQLDRNFLGKHCLHGGARHMGTRVWRVRHRGARDVELGLTLADGEMGFPGRMDVHLRYALTGHGTLELTLEAKTDAPTLCNLALHPYFSLGGTDVRDLELRLAADRYTPTDDDLIPTGEIRSVAGDLYDFRDFRALRDVSEVRPLDINFCTADAQVPMRPVAWLRHPGTGVALEMQTTEPGLQVFDAAPLTAEGDGVAGQPTGRFCGLALEAQGWPDAIHHPHFPQTVLRPGETYHQTTAFVVTRNP